MAGHSHWAGIKRQKEITDKKRGRLFSKLLMAISAAAKLEPNPDFNPRLRTAVEKARTSNVPSDSIFRAIKRAGEAKDTVEELVYEAYGPEGAALMVFVATDNRNRAVQEIKKALAEAGAKWAEEGSVRWAFEKIADGEWRPKFPQEVSAESKEKLASIMELLEELGSVQKIITNAK